MGKLNLEILIMILMIANRRQSVVTSEDIMLRFGITRRTLSRWIEHANEIGAKIVPARSEGKSFWICENFEEIQDNLIVLSDMAYNLDLRKEYF